MTRPIRYFFGRLNVVMPSDQKKALLKKGFEAKQTLSKYGCDWGFFDIQEIETEEGVFFAGYLAKFKSEGEAEVAMPEKHQLVEESIKNKVIAKSRFFLHVKSGLMAYHPVGADIDRETFSERFVALFQLGQDFFFDADVQAIEEQYKILETMKKFEKITKVRISLHPSNPSNTDLWKGIDDRLKKIGVSNYIEEFETKNPENGLEIVDDLEVKGKVAMADDGYGRADVTGIIEGEHKTISTKDNPISVAVTSAPEEAEKTLDSLMTTIRKIFSRFNKKK